MNSLMTQNGVQIAMFVINLLLTVTLVSLVALLVARTGFRHHPAMRYVVCLAGLVCLLISPFSLMLQGKTGYPEVVVSLQLGTQRISSTAELATNAIQDNGRNREETTDRNARPTEPSTYLFWCVGSGLAVWAIGLLWQLVRLVRGLKATRALRRTAIPLGSTLHGLPDSQVSDLKETQEQVARQLGIATPAILIASGMISPVVIGLFRPVVILPLGLLETLRPAQLRQVLLHECAHVAHGHMLAGIVQRLVLIVFWPHPVVIALCKEMARIWDEVCDNVAAQEEGAVSYARTLLIIAQALTAAPSYTLALLQPGAGLEERITGLLNPRRNRMTDLKRWQWLAAIGMVAFTLTSAIALRVVAQEASKEADKLGTDPVSGLTKSIEGRDTSKLPVPISVRIDATHTSSIPAYMIMLKCRFLYTHRDGHGRKVVDVRASPSVSTFSGGETTVETALEDGSRITISLTPSSRDGKRVKMVVKVVVEQVWKPVSNTKPQIINKRIYHSIAEIAFNKTVRIPLTQDYRPIPAGSTGIEFKPVKDTSYTLELTPSILVSNSQGQTFPASASSPSAQRW